MNETKCTRCGNQVNPQTGLCTVCGQPVYGQYYYPTQANTQPAQNPIYATQSPANSQPVYNAPVSGQRYNVQQANVQPSQTPNYAAQPSVTGQPLYNAPVSGQAYYYVPQANIQPAQVPNYATQSPVGTQPVNNTPVSGQAYYVPQANTQPAQVPTYATQSPVGTQPVNNTPVSGQPNCAQQASTQPAQTPDYYAPVPVENQPVNTEQTNQQQNNAESGESLPDEQSIAYNPVPGQTNGSEYYSVPITPYDPQAGISAQRLTNYTPVENQPAKKKKSPIKILLPIAIALVLLVVVGIVIKISKGADNTGYSSNGSSGSNSATGTGEYSGYVATGTKTDTTKTVMIYLVGSNLESEGGAASLDIVEMVEADYDKEISNVILCTGGSSMWHNTVIDENEVAYYLVGDDNITLLKSTGDNNMADSSTLSDFISYSMENYSADMYGLILWDHGGGPMEGYGSDERYNKKMYLPEITDALSCAGLGYGNKLEFIGFDACLMGSVEVAGVFSDYAEYLIASEESEPGTGWEYSFLSVLDTAENGEEIGKAAVDAYIESSEIYQNNLNWDNDLSLACFDLSKTDALESSMNSLFENIDSNILNNSYSVIARAVKESKSIGKSSNSPIFDLIDVYSLISNLPDYCKTDADAFKDAVDDMICYVRTNSKNLCGVSIFHPYENKDHMNEWLLAYGNFNFASGYNQYLNSFCNLMNSGKASDSWKTFSKSTVTAGKSGSSNNLKVQLSEEQIETFASAKYYVFADVNEKEEGGYLWLLTGYDAVLGSDGVLSASYKNQVVYGIDSKSGDEGATPIAMRQIDDGSGEKKYLAGAIYQKFGEDLEDWIWDNVKVQICIDSETGAASMQGAFLDTDDVSYAQKQLVDFNDYEMITFASSTYHPTYDSDGDLLPPSEWTTGDWILGNEFEVDAGFHVEARALDSAYDYYAVFVVTDVYGNQFATEMIKVQ